MFWSKNNIEFAYLWDGKDNFFFVLSVVSVLNLPFLYCNRSPHLLVWGASGLTPSQVLEMKTQYHTIESSFSDLYR